MNSKKIIISISLVTAIFFCSYFYIRKDVIYIHFENIQDYNYEFLGQDKLKSDKIILKKTGNFWYQWWEFDLDTSNIRIMDIDKLNDIDIVSQYWIINNLNGFAIEFDYGKTKQYKLNIVRNEGEKIWIYPVKDIHFITE